MRRTKARWIAYRDSVFPAATHLQSHTCTRTRAIARASLERGEGAGHAPRLTLAGWHGAGEAGGQRKGANAGVLKPDFGCVGSVTCGAVRLRESVRVRTDAWMVFTVMSTVVTRGLQPSGDFLLFKTLQFCKFLYESVF